MKEIRLTQGKVALVDDADFVVLSQYSWFAHRNKASTNWYAGRNTTTPRGRRRVDMHRQLLGVGPWVMVDHRNRNSLDNRRENLRVATPEQNAQNRKRALSKKTSRYHGVCWYAPTNRWKAQIQARGKKRGLGYYLAEDDAARAYDRAAREEFGEFAVINLPTTCEAPK